MLRSQNIWLESLDLDNDDGVFFHGGTLHRIGESLENRTGLLLQFISADCKVREEQNSVWGSQRTSYNLYLPPTLLVAADDMKLGAVNDVRVSLSHEDGLLLKLAKKKKQRDHLMGSQRRLTSVDGEFLEVDTVTVFSEANATLEWENEGVWKMHKIGEVSTSVMANGRIEHLLLESTSSMDFGVAAGDGERVIVMLSEGLLYFRVASEGEFRHYELLELRRGSAVLLSKNVWQALVPLESEASMVSLYWVGQENKEFLRKTFNNEVIEAQFVGTKSKGHLGTQATEGRTITLGSGQAYDPDNNEYCDVIIFMVEGYLLQVLPSNVTLQALEVLLIPARQSCILWNIGGLAVKFFAMHLCRTENEMQAMMSFGASGKVF